MCHLEVTASLPSLHTSLLYKLETIRRQHTAILQEEAEILAGQTRAIEALAEQVATAASSLPLDTLLATRPGGSCLAHRSGET